MRKLLKRTGIVSLAVAGLAGSAPMATQAASQQASQQAVAASGGVVSLHGWARLDGQDHHDPLSNVTVAVDAHAEKTEKPLPDKSWGRMVLRHVWHNTDGDVVASVRFDIKVNCLAHGRNNATVTGTVENVDLVSPEGTPPPPSVVGALTGISFYLDPTDRGMIGWSGLPDKATDPPVTTRCMAPAATFDVIKGGYRLTHSS